MSPNKTFLKRVRILRFDPLFGLFHVRDGRWMYRVSCPLPLTNPELIVIEAHGCTEYRVENWRLARDGSGRVVYGFSGCTWKDMFLIAALSFLLQAVRANSNVNLSCPQLWT